MGDDGFETLHEVGADLPEECLHAMCDEMPIGIQYLYPSLAGWEVFWPASKGTVAIRAYSWYKKILQMLSMQCGETTGSKRWVLKSPAHILFIKELAEVFPDAKLVW